MATNPAISAVSLLVKQIEFAQDLAKERMVLAPAIGGVTTMQAEESDVARETELRIKNLWARLIREHIPKDSPVTAKLTVTPELDGLKLVLEVKNIAAFPLRAFQTALSMDVKEPAAGAHRAGLAELSTRGMNGSQLRRARK